MSIDTLHRFGLSQSISSIERRDRSDRRDQSAPCDGSTCTCAPRGTNSANRFRSSPAFAGSTAKNDTTFPPDTSACGYVHVPIRFHDDGGDGIQKGTSYTAAMSTPSSFATPIERGRVPPALRLRPEDVLVGEPVHVGHLHVSIHAHDADVVHRDVATRTCAAQEPRHLDLLMRGLVHADPHDASHASAVDDGDQQENGRERPCKAGKGRPQRAGAQYRVDEQHAHHQPDRHQVGLVPEEAADLGVREVHQDDPEVDVRPGGRHIPAGPSTPGREPAQHRATARPRRAVAASAGSGRIGSSAAAWRARAGCSASWRRSTPEGTANPGRG